MIDLDEVKSRINPAYANSVGTESYERRLLVEEIESLRTQLAEANEVIRVAKDALKWLSENGPDDAYDMREEASQTLANINELEGK